MLAVYILSLVMSASLFGLFSRDVLAEVGYLPGFAGGIAIAAAAALLYACAQAMHVALLRLIKPTKAPAYLLMEVLSHAATVVLLPHILHVSVAWPHPILEKVETGIYFGVFLLAHSLFKLAGFYACLRATPAGRGGALGWIATSGALFLASWLAFNAWLGTMTAARSQTPENYSLLDARGVLATAAPLVEGGEAVWSVKPASGAGVYLRLASPGDAAQAYVTVTMEGVQTRAMTKVIALPARGWATLRIPPEELPQSTEVLRVSWRADRDPVWERLLGLPPVIRWDKALWVSEPAVHGPAAPETGPNIVVVLVEGLAGPNMSLMGYPRHVTPSLDAVARANVWFQQAISPAPDAAEVLASLLSGLHPLALAEHGSVPGSLAASLSEQGYATAAFVEDLDGGGPLLAGAGFALVDTVYDPGEGSAATLRRAREWIADHEDVRHFVIVRLGELADPEPAERYGKGFLKDGVDAQTARDIYDSALLFLDNELGQWLHELESGPSGRRLCYAVTAPYGLDFSRPDGMPVAGLTEHSLHVPLLLRLPSRLRAQRDDLCSLEQLGCALRALGRVGGAATGVMDAFGAQRVVSSTTNPPVISLRNGTWRFNVAPASPGKAAHQLSLHYVGSSPDATRGQNVLARHTATADRLAEEIDLWLEWVQSPAAAQPCAKR